MNALERLRQWTTVVADTGDFNAMRSYAPRDATTNPSLIVKALQKPDYRSLVDETVAAHRDESVEQLCDRLLVRFGCEILSIVPGRVSTEVDARSMPACRHAKSTTTPAAARPMTSLA